MFLHADCVLPSDALAQVRHVMRTHRAGCFPIRFDAPGPFMRWNGFASNARVRLFGIMFGDQGMFFDRDLFFEMGGFPELPLMEDYELSLRLKARGIRPGLASSRITASARRYTNGSRSRIGTALHMLKLRRDYRMGRPVEELLAEYRSIR